MKRKITYLIKDFDAMLKEILEKSKDFKSQVELIKNKEFIFEKIDKMAKKYDKIIADIKEKDEESEDEI
jgi:hypothetical protein